jgi:hypothetical protein
MSRWSPYTSCVAVSCLALSGCAIDGYSWEQAGRVDEVVIRLTEVADAGPVCARYLPGETVLACSVDRGDYCEIIVPHNSPALVAHEAAHCLGYKHPGGQDVTASLRERSRAAAARRARTDAMHTDAGAGPTSHALLP